MDVPVLRWAWLGTVGYGDAWALQREVALARRSGEPRRRRGAPARASARLHDGPPGRGAPPRRRARCAPSPPGAEFVEVDRGGSVTFHGPGQLVAYPIVRLAGHLPDPRPSRPRRRRPLPPRARGGAHRHRRALRRRGRPGGHRYTGVWSGERKLGAIGVKLAGGVTTHGVALNVATDLQLVRPDHALRHRGRRRSRRSRPSEPRAHARRRWRRCSPPALASAFGRRLDDAGPLEALVAPSDARGNSRRLSRRRRRGGELVWTASRRFLSVVSARSQGPASGALVG